MHRFGSHGQARPPAPARNINTYASVAVDGMDVHIMEAGDPRPPGTVLTPVRRDPRQDEYETQVVAEVESGTALTTVEKRRGGHP